MKKLIFILAALLAISTTAQTTPSYPTVKLTAPAVGGGTDDVLTIGSTKKINKVTKASLLSGLATTTYVDAVYATKAPIASPTFTGTVSGITKAMVGLGNVDNTTDATKPISTATQTAIDTKQNTLVSGTNIKTINGNSLLGSGDITISGGGSTAPLEFNTTDLTVWNNGKGNAASNTTFGESALKSITTGYGNSAFGNSTLQNVTTGYSNDAFGLSSLTSLTTGDSNSAFGESALKINTTGWSNTAFGRNALKNLIGNNNVAIGAGAGEVVSNGIVLSSATNSVFIGLGTRALANSESNQIVVGAGAIGAGSNTATLGNTSIITTILRGTINVAGLQVFANNAAAITGGLLVGDMYRTSTGQLMVRY